MSRFRANQKELKDGHPRISRWLELIPPEAHGFSLNVDDEEMALGIEAAQQKMLVLGERARVPR